MDMKPPIEFAVKAPDEATFWQGFIDAGICTEPRVFADAYRDVECTALQGWSGIIVKTPATFDADGNELTPAVMVPGWHCNIRIVGPLVDQFTQGLPQYDESGIPLPLFERTHAVAVFGLTAQPADEESGFPAGYRNNLGVHFADIADIATPANVRE